jgi:UDP-N-acetylmuramate dehydrogenase
MFQKPMPQVAINIPLAPLTTLELGGSADQLITLESEANIGEALAHARNASHVTVLGGGSNVIVPDAGVRGVVLLVRTTGREVQSKGDQVELRLAAGENWDDIVAWTVSQGWQGLECLSGIPGLVGATPIQNVGAYGCEVADTVTQVELVDLKTGEATTWSATQCEFKYRDSRLKQQLGRWLVTHVHFRLSANGSPPLRYAELQKRLAETPAPSLQHVRDTVLALRRSKSMVLDFDDPNRRSVGSFFTNPIVSEATAARVEAIAAQRNLAAPRWRQDDGQVKLAAGWLIEQSGITKGLRRGPVGISSRHALALVHHGGGSTAQLLSLADEVTQAVLAKFGIQLQREAVLL